MFVNKLFTYHMKTKILADFQICISVPLKENFTLINEI